MESIAIGSELVIEFTEGKCECGCEVGFEQS